ncbi:fibrillarin-like rRNA/tRNA 2'-O-methyltransferase [Candidatus Woesearchaeota archaeon]|nr:fibrillarin-like rRNA/tRNA 2'-O-methyltransferase [Candidatus Woesearchaeota archaeon]
MRRAQVFEVYEDGKGKHRQLFTKSLVPGKQVYGEQLVRDGPVEYRAWDPERSKLCAAILKGCQNTGLRKGDIVLYLGASTGTTPSHVSDIVGREGFVFALDFAPRVVRELVFLSENRPNIAPILGDAHQPMTYAHRLSMVDYVYQDIAQADQTKIFLDNIKVYLKKGGFAFLCVKAKSINIATKPKQIYKQVRDELEKVLTIIDYRELDPFEKDHCIFVCKY